MLEEEDELVLGLYVHCDELQEAGFGDDCD